METGGSGIAVFGQSYLTRKESSVEYVTLKRGRGSLRLEKSENLIGIRPSSQAGELAQILAAAPVDVPPESEVLLNLGGFKVVKVPLEKGQMETVLDGLRRHYLVDAGTHVFHTPGSSVPYVPT